MRHQKAQSQRERGHVNFFNGSGSLSLQPNWIFLTVYKKYQVKIGNISSKKKNTFLFPLSDLFS